MRLIDADALKELRHAIIKGHIEFDGSEYDIIDRCPTVDVVEVVRCKDCVNAYINSFSAASRIVHCLRLARESDGMVGVRQFDDFCSYGERREP